MLNRVLIIGGGVAAMRCALELRRQGYERSVRLVSVEATPPYDRTLVSKDLLSGDAVDDQRLLLQPPAVYEDADKVRLAADACPTRAITIADRPGDAHA